MGLDEPRMVQKGTEDQGLPGRHQFRPLAELRARRGLPVRLSRRLLAALGQPGALTYAPVGRNIVAPGAGRAHPTLALAAGDLAHHRAIEGPQRLAQLALVVGLD